MRKKKARLLNNQTEIGPAYVEVARIGIRMIDLLDTNVLHQKLIQNIEDINRALENIYKEPIIDAQELIHELEGAITKLSPYICNTTHMLHEALEIDENILLEGAQGCLLDVDHGTYPCHLFSYIRRSLYRKWYSSISYHSSNGNY